MGTKIIKQGLQYFIEGTTPIEEEEYTILPQFGPKENLFLWLLMRASLDLDIKYYRKPNTKAQKYLNLEPDFYIHLGNLWEKYVYEYDSELSVNNDLTKRIDMEDKKPDLILNVRWGDRQEIVVEVKRNVSNTNTEAICKDWDKLLDYTKGKYNEERQRFEFINGYASYKIGVFYLMGGTMNDLLSKLMKDPERVNASLGNIGKWSDRILCICSPGDGTLEYATLEEIKESMK